MGTDVRVILVTCPDEAQALALARGLVDEHLVACVNVLGNVRSIYRWRNRVCDDREVLLIMKTREDLVREVVDRVTAEHPYEVPEVIALPVVAGAESYLAWVRDETHNGEAS